MQDDFNQDIFDIISKRVDKKQLEGFKISIFNPEKDKFIAYTLVDLKQVNYEEFSWSHQKIGGGSCYLDHEESEKKKKWVSANSWTSKSTEECIIEGIYRFFSISFAGVFFEYEWFISSSLGFYGSHFTELSVDKLIHEIRPKNKIFENEIFNPVKIFSTHNIHGHEKIVKNVGFEEFENHPFVVAHQKQRIKEEINRLFSSYFNKEYIEPLFQKLKLLNSKEFQSFIELRSNFTCIFSQNKRNIIFCALVSDQDLNSRLYYFVLINDKYYKWTYFKAKVFDYALFYSQVIIDDLKQISHWDEDAYLDSSCTMDDANFWNEYVFKKNDNNEFVYLEELMNVSLINNHAYN